MSNVPLNNNQVYDLFPADLNPILEREENVVPPAYDIVPSNKTLTGPYDFNIEIPEANAKGLLYSERLDKYFMKMKTDFTVLFRWAFDLPKTELIVRATPRFSSLNDATKPIKRCGNHFQEDSNFYPTALMKYHVLRCNNSQAVYEGGADKHFSVYVRPSPPEDGTDSVSFMYQLLCRTTCLSKKKAPIEIIFTLEDDSGHVYGRKSVKVRICEFPNRELNDEEEKAGYIPAKISAPNGRSQKSKKRCSKIIKQRINEDTKIYSVTVKMLGLKAKKDVLKSAYNINAGRMMLNPEVENACKPLLKGIKNQIDKC